MKIDLTYKCSMGCSHCMSACTENGEEMKLDVLKDVMGFIKTHKYRMFYYQVESYLSIVAF